MPTQQPGPADGGRLRYQGRRLGWEDGYTMAFVMLLLVPLTIAVAFATDVGQWYAQATRMQRAADAAAMAGVVWIEDPLDTSHWSTTALDVAGRNGFADGSGLNGGTVGVTATKVASNQVRVCITAPALLFFSRLVIRTETLTRCATAAFNISVPLGSPRNYLGTGDLGKGSTGTAYEKENMWLAVSGRCTDKSQGDRKAAGYANGAGSSNSCSSSTNSEYQDDNYLVYVDLPLTRSYDTDVLVYNGNLSTSSGCGSNSNGNRTRESCPGSGTASGYMSTTFTLYASDSTVFDDGDNPALLSTQCGMAGAPSSATGEKTFSARTNYTLETNTTFNPSSSNFTNTSSDGTTGGSGWWDVCRIPASFPGGRYLLRVRNASSAMGGATESTVGSNAFSVVANRVQSPGLCDSRSNSDCPRVYAKDYLSVYATAAGTADFFLAEVGSQHAGKKVQIDLWDPAEGATNLRVQYPLACTGSPGSDWGYQTFNWSDSGGNSQNSVSNIPISSYNFNNRLVTITFTLPTTWSPPACNQWFRIEYSYGSTATDRTTWSLKILGDPVRLVG